MAISKSICRRSPPAEEPDKAGPRRSLKRVKHPEVDDAGPSHVHVAKSAGAKKAKVAPPPRTALLGNGDDAPLLDPKSVDPVHQWMIMLEERMEKQEDKLAALELEQEERFKDMLVRIILSGAYRHSTDMDSACLSVFAFLLGFPAGSRKKSPKELYSSLPRAADGTANVPERAAQLFNIQQAKDEELYPKAATERPLKAFWELTNADFRRSGSIKRSLDFGFGFEHVLKAMTLEELEQYWEWHMDSI